MSYNFFDILSEAYTEKFTVGSVYRVFLDRKVNACAVVFFAE